MIDEYEKDLENYIRKIDRNRRKWLKDKNQISALDLLMDVNWVGWWSVKNSTTDILDLMSWDFASIWAWIWAGFWTWALLGSWTWAWALVTWWVWAIAWWATATTWMMVNHGEDYFSEDWWKWLTELGINTAMFGVWWIVFKWARAIQGTSWILSKRWVLTLWGEATVDVLIWTTSDMLRAWAYEADIELIDALKNNLVWAFLPLALRLMRADIF